MKRYKTKRDSSEEPVQQGRAETMEKVFQLALDNRELVIHILELLNQPDLGIDVVSRIVELVRKSIGVEAVGIRLRKDEDYPYIAAHGFTDKFIKMENSVCSRSGSGEMLRDSEGNPILECMCGEIIRGRTDPSLPFFTVGGSFWTNCRSKLVESNYGLEIKHLLRHRFVLHGYESVAIVPLRFGNGIIGLLQFNDSRENQFYPEMIRFFEKIAGIIGVGLARMQTEEESRQANDELQNRVEKQAAEVLKARKILEEQMQERKAVEQELLMSHQKLESAMEASNMGSWDWNLNTDQIYFDQRWNRSFGYSMNEVESDFAALQNRIPRDDKINILKTLKQHLTNPTNYFEIEYRLQVKPGEWIWILDRGKVVECDENGKPLRMAGIYLDITDFKRVYEEQLHETAERFRGIFESARDCIFVKDTSLRYTQVNPYFANLLDLPESRIVGNTDNGLFDQDSADILAEVDRRVLAGETVEQEHTRPVKGVPRTFIDTKVPMRNSQGQITGIIGISREITGRKRNVPDDPSADIDFQSPIMQATLRTARLAAQTDTIVLLTGESGAGKDHFARYIHEHSKRANGPFFSINCAAVSPELAESELFGYESGAFTGSKGPKRGLLELAEGGTILLNEIGELSTSLQAKLLTFLDTRQFTRVGGVRLFTVNARLIAATNRNLEREVEANRFRQDLFYRLDVFSLEVPPLRQRTEDIPRLVNTIVADLSSKLGFDPVPQIESKVLKALRDYPWPGNVRELRNVLERALILCDKKRISPSDVVLNGKPKGREVAKEWSVTFRFPENETINDVTMNLKRHLVVEALRRANGNRRRAAKLLGISADSLKYYIQLFDLHMILPFQSRARE